MGDILNSAKQHDWYAHDETLAEELIAEIKRLRQANVTWAYDTIKLITAIRYLIGIAERGEGREINSNETAEGFVLAYVKKLESENERLRAELAKPFAYCTEPRSEILRRQQEEIERLRELLLEAAPYVIYWRKNQIDLATEEADDWNRLRFRLWKWCNDQEALGD